MMTTLNSKKNLKKSIRLHTNPYSLWMATVLAGLLSCQPNNGNSLKERNLNTTSISIKGSDTVLPLAQSEAESFLKKNPESAITVVGGGSGVGITSLLENNTDIAMTSRELKFEERVKFEEKNNKIKELIIAKDALAVIVHPENKIKKLTRAQLEAIFTGEINNWKKLGGDDLQIVVYARESSSGTFEFFKEVCMENKNYAPSVLSLPATGSIIQAVSQTNGAIGYVGMAYLDPKIKAVSISFDNQNFIDPLPENATNNTYPILRPLYFYYLETNQAKVKPFIDYVLSEEGQKIVTKVGYVATKETS